MEDNRITVEEKPLNGIMIIIIMVPQSWIINCLKMYKISHEVINSIEKPHENLDSGVDSRSQKLS